jgi:hypothetical protein
MVGAKTRVIENAPKEFKSKLSSQSLASLVKTGVLIEEEDESTLIDAANTASQI